MTSCANRKTLSSVAAVLGALLMLGACSDPSGGGGGSGGSHQATGTFTTREVSYEPYQAVEVRVPVAGLAEGTRIQGKLGDASLDLVKGSDSTLVFVLPAAPGAAPTLRFTVGDTAYSGSIAVRAASPMPDPQAYLTAAMAGLEQSITALPGEIEADTFPYDKQQLLQRVQEARDSVARYKQLVSQLTPAEREYLARFLQANVGGLLDEMQAGVAGSASAGQRSVLRVGAQRNMIPVECRLPKGIESYKCTWGVFGGHLANLAYYWSLAALAATTIPTTGPLGIAVSGVIGAGAMIEGLDAFRTGAVLAVWTGMAAWEIGVAAVDGASSYFRARAISPSPGIAPGQAGGSTSADVASLTEVTSNQPLTFSFEAQYRRAQPGDLNSGVSWLSTALGLVKKYNDFAGRFLGQRFTIGFASPAAGWLAANPGEISVEVAQNANVRVASQRPVPGGFEVTFASDATTPQSFSYDIVYNAGVYPQVRVRYQATLLPVRYAVAAASGGIVRDTVHFSSNIAQSFRLVLDDGSSAAGVDYSQVNVANNSNSAVSVAIARQSSGFTLTLALASQTASPRTKFDLTYRGQRVQSIDALMDTLPWPTSYSGAWSYQGYGNLTPSCQYYFQLTGTVTVAVGAPAPGGAERPITLTLAATGTRSASDVAGCLGATTVNTGQTVSGQVKADNTFYFLREGTPLPSTGWTFAEALGTVSRSSVTGRFLFGPIGRPSGGNFTATPVTP
jgi:hypothetical protein